MLPYDVHIDQLRPGDVILKSGAKVVSVVISTLSFTNPEDSVVAVGLDTGSFRAAANSKVLIGVVK